MAFEWAERIADAMFTTKKFNGDEEQHYIIRPALLVLLFASIILAYGFSWRVNAQTEQKVDERITYNELSQQFQKEREFQQQVQKQNTIQFQQLQKNFQQQQQQQRAIIENVSGMSRLLEYLVQRQDGGSAVSNAQTELVDKLTTFYVDAFRVVVNRDTYTVKEDPFREDGYVLQDEDFQAVAFSFEDGRVILMREGVPVPTDIPSDKIRMTPPEPTPEPEAVEVTEVQGQ
jgi:hypothetical protein